MIRTFLVAAVVCQMLPTSSLSQDLVREKDCKPKALNYFTPADTMLCRRLGDLRAHHDASMRGKKPATPQGCVLAPENTTVHWDGCSMSEAGSTNAVFALVESSFGQMLTWSLALRSTRIRDIYEADFITSEGQILCRSAYDLTEARKAIGDSRWMRELGCIVAKPGLKAIKIEPDSLSERGPWRVRVEFPDGPGGVTLWGERYHFRFTDGSRVGYGG